MFVQYPAAIEIATVHKRPAQEGEVEEDEAEDREREQEPQGP
jgi:hypothetical protein